MQAPLGTPCTPCAMGLDERNGAPEVCRALRATESQLMAQLKWVKFRQLLAYPAEVLTRCSGISIWYFVLTRQDVMDNCDSSISMDAEGLQGTAALLGRSGNLAGIDLGTGENTYTGAFSWDLSSMGALPSLYPPV